VAYFCNLAFYFLFLRILIHTGACFGAARTQKKVGFALLKLEGTQWNFTAAMKHIRFKITFPRWLGWDFTIYEKCYLLNTKGVASQRRGCPLSNFSGRNDG